MKRRAAYLAGVLLLVAVWSLLHPAQPMLSLGDLYTHLGVARHLARGEGFLNDTVYPLSLAFPFAATVPQPLVHRQPLFPLLLTLPYLATGGDPQATIAAVRIMHIGLLAGIAVVGIAAYRRRRAGAAAAPWLVVLALNPLLAFAVDWGQIEVVVALVLLGIWVRWRTNATSGPDGSAQPPVGPGQACGDGLLAGILTALRGDLFWLPVFWWLILRRRCGLRAAIVAGSVWLALSLPWAIRNLQLTGNPVFCLQAHAEHVKDTAAWPGYSIYRSLSPQPFLATIRDAPQPILRKVGRGIDYFTTNLGQLLPWPLWASVPLLLWRRYRDRDRARLAAPAPLAVALATLGLLLLQYALFSHSIRHLLILLPIVVWEICLACARSLVAAGRRWPPSVTAVAAGLLVAIACLVPPRPRLGWESTAQWAAAEAPGLARQIDQAVLLPPGPVFTDNAAVLWYADRAGVWSPLSRDVENSIREKVPELAAAPRLYLRTP